MNVCGPKVSRHRLGQASLRGLRGRESSCARHAPSRECSSDDDDVASPWLFTCGMPRVVVSNRPRVFTRKELSRIDGLISSMVPMCLFRRCTRECVPVPCRVVSRRTFAPPIPHRSRHSCRRVHRRDLLPAVYSSRLFARGVPRQIPPSKSDVRAPLRSLDLLQPLRILFPSS